MQKLKDANLYRNELIPVSGKLVERYNKCLVKLGFTPTSLTSFSIDGVGWSPEIAEEKQTKFYLNNGEANEHAIIISPLQKGIALYHPFHSFNKEIMKYVFKKHQKVINDITRDAAICIDFDQKIDVFYEPLDVLKYKEVVVKFHLINNLNQAKENQLQLIDIFNKGTNFINENLHQQLLASAKDYGDLRDRNLNLEGVVFPVRSFYTKAFGGVFVLRDFVEPILIFEDKNVYKEAINDTIHEVFMYHISQKELIEKLKSYAILELDVEEEATKKRYSRIKKFIFSSFLKNTAHSVNNILEDPILFKSYLNKIDTESRKKVMGVELFLEKKKMVKQLSLKDSIDPELYVAMHKPHSSLLASHQDLIWHLLVTISPKDVLFLYWYNKEQFYTQFKTLESTTQDWVIATILKEF